METNVTSATNENLMTFEEIPSNDFLEGVKGIFHCTAKDIRTYSPLTLAYIGDSVFDMVVRTVIVLGGNRKAKDLHKISSGYVKATSQSVMINAILPKLSEEETEIYNRGSNAKVHTVPKNATLHEYSNATGFEALVGWLYLSGDTARAIELIKLGMSLLDMS